MKKIVFVIGMLCLIGLGSCNTHKSDRALLSRDFITGSWERFDFITNPLEIKKPTTYDLSMLVTFDPSYTFDYISVVFTVFDADEHPMRSKSYKFSIKDGDGTWKSQLKDGLYHFTLPINSEMDFKEPGTYTLQLENRMPTTPLNGIHHVSIVSN